MPIAVISRFISWFHDFGIPVGGVLVNMRIDSSVVNSDSAEFVRQSRVFAAAISAPTLIGKGLDHFRMAETLGDPGSPLGRAALAMLE